MMDPDRSILVLAGLTTVNGALLAFHLWTRRLWPLKRDTAKSPLVPQRRAITTALVPSTEMPDHPIVHKAIAFSEKTVGEVMVPRPDMICIRADATLPEILALAGSSSHSRLPVFAADVDHIEGFVHAKDLLKLAREGTGSLTARALMRPILAVPENKPIHDMLREFQSKKTHVSIVFDEFGGTAGMVTINDLLEELVGEIFDEVRPVAPEVEPMADGRYRLAGRISIESVNERFGLNLPADDFNTLAGLVFGCLGRTPKPGDTVEISEVRFCVEATNGRRATQIMLLGPMG